MRVTEKRRSTCARHTLRSISGARAIASSSSASLSQMKPVRRCATTSGIAPQRRASTGVPHAIASIITRPKGSGQDTGNNNARAPRSSATFF
jgi:hypothetical protein